MYFSKYNFVFEIDGDTIIFNPLSGAFDVLDKIDIERLEKIRFNQDVDEEVIKQFLRRGYIYSNEEDEQKELYKMYNLYEEITSRKERYVLCPTYTCNLNCTYCFQTGLIKRTSDLMSNKVLKKALKS